MKVCMVSPTLPPTHCGVADYTAKLCEELAVRGIKIYIVTSKAHSSSVSYFKHQNILVLPVIENFGMGLFKTISRVLTEVCPDILHIQYHIGLYNGSPIINILLPNLMLKHKGVQTIVTMHDPPRLSRKGMLKKPIFLLTGIIPMVLSNRVIFTKYADTYWWAARLPYIKEKIHFIPVGSGINPVKSGDSVSQYSLDSTDDSTILGFFGFIRKDKGFHTLIAAMRKLLDEGYRVRLLVIGAQEISSAYIEKIKVLIRSLDLEKYITWTGYIPDQEVLKFISEIDIAVLPFTDGISTTRSSIMLFAENGIPIVSTQGKHQFPGFREHYNILLVPPENPDELANAIAELINSSTLREKLSKNIKAMANMFDWSKIAKDTVELYYNARRK